MVKMYVEYAQEPLAIGTCVPRFSWTVDVPGRGRKQSAYRILVATEAGSLQVGEPDLWDSGRIESSQSVNVEYGGIALRSNADCYWSVEIWDEAGASMGIFPPAYFGTALFDASDWQAKWIGMGDPDEPLCDPALFQHGGLPPEVAALEPDDRSPMLRKAFVITKPVRRARAYVCGLGLYELRLNGKKVGDDVLSTPRTEFRKQVVYNTYDVTNALLDGQNALGLLLGNGWFNAHKKYWGWQKQWYGSPRGIVQLMIDYEDGSSQTVGSDASWKGTWSPITHNCIYDGEIYDARLEHDGWDTPAFDDATWEVAHIVPEPGGILTALRHEPGKVVERFRPVAMCEPSPGVYVYDMGRNMTGWVRICIKAGKAGDKITLRFGEAQHADGSLNTKSSNAALQRDQYIARGSGWEEYEPRFTYHGFQYVEITGYPGLPDLDALEGCFVRTAVAETSSFSCGHELLNRIHACTMQSQKCNIQMGVPTDDTQRPERLGWAGDAWSFAEECFYNLWSPRVYAKWIADFGDQQASDGMVGMIVPQAGPEEDLVWSAAFILIPWWQYVFYGDRRILEDNYANMQRYLEYLERTGLRDIQTMPTHEVLAKLRYHCAGDARFPSEAEHGYLQISQWGDHLSTHEGGSGNRKNQPLSIATAFYHADVITMVQIAETLGRADDAAQYRQLARKIKDAFNARFYDAGSGYYDVGCQSAQAWALVFDLVDAEHRDAVEMYLNSSVNHRQRRLTTGYAGTKWAIRAIADSGRNDIVWSRAIATDYPSWGYMLRDPKRTTIAENWLGEGGSLCHTTLGAAIDEWFFRDLLGIRPDPSAPGFEHIVIQPYMPSDLPWAKGGVQTVRGEVSVSWQHDGESATLTVLIPANSTATIHIPAGLAQITEGGVPAAKADGVQKCTDKVDKTEIAIGSGSYVFGFPVPRTS